ncbi:MAG: hypothetical protein ACYTHJ_03775 [Planctomycetota bacterium]
MADKKARYPNYDEIDESPGLGGPGVAMKLAPPADGVAYGVGEPIIMHGIVGANGKQHARSGGEILVKAFLRAVRTKDEKELSFPVKDGDNVVLEDIPEPRDADAYEVYAWFNVDLTKHLKLPEEPGEYTVELCFYDFKTDPLDIKIEFKPKNKD